MSALDRAWRQERLDPFKGSDMPLGGGMSALDRAWRQGRLDPFKGSDMPLMEMWPTTAKGEGRGLKGRGPWAAGSRAVGLRAVGRGPWAEAR